MTDAANKPLTFFRFEDLRVYHKALDYGVWVQKTIQQFPDCGKSLAGSFCDMARRIPMHIAEGSAREKAAFISHLKEGKSAIRSCLVLSTLAYRHGFITQAEEEESRNQLMELTKMLGALITSLQKSPSGPNDHLEDELFPARNW
ncbi:MAG TPA: four helix bundle protein [Bacteroidales bacterium]|nr:four helix bundle protein [Bacteroidales bacterium]